MVIFCVLYLLALSRPIAFSVLGVTSLQAFGCKEKKKEKNGIRKKIFKGTDVIITFIYQGRRGTVSQL